MPGSSQPHPQSLSGHPRRCVRIGHAHSSPHHPCPFTAFADLYPHAVVGLGLVILRDDVPASMVTKSQGIYQLRVPQEGRYLQPDSDEGSADRLTWGDRQSTAPPKVDRHKGPPADAGLRSPTGSGEQRDPQSSCAVADGPRRGKTSPSLTLSQPPWQASNRQLFTGVSVVPGVLRTLCAYPLHGLARGQLHSKPYQHPSFLTCNCGWRARVRQSPGIPVSGSRAQSGVPQ